MNRPNGGLPRFIQGESAGLDNRSTIDARLFLTHTGAPHFAWKIYDTNKPPETDGSIDNLGKQLELLW
jgi:hypothetical protein